MEPILGQIAALGAAFCWSICTPCFTLAGRRIGSIAVNIYRLVIAGVLLSLYGWLVRGLPFPTDAPVHTYLWMIGSGVIGFFLCDLCLFRSFLLIGPRLAMLIFAMAPPLATLIDWGFRDVTLTSKAMLGMAITLSGIVWVVLEKASPSDATTARTSPSQKKFGITLASIAAICQAAGTIFASAGLAPIEGTEGYDPFAATQIRLYAGLFSFLVMITVLQRWRPVLSGVKDRRALGWLSIGAVTGPFLGVSLCLLSLKHIPTGMAMTLMALPPVFILPFARILLNEKFSLRAVLGAIVAVVGVGILFWT